MEQKEIRTGGQLPRADDKGTEAVDTGWNEGNNLGESDWWSVKVSGATV